MERRSFPLNGDSAIDLALVVRYNSGDEKAFEELYLRYKAKLFSFINKIVMDSSKSEDLLQETFFRVFLHISSFDPGKKFSSWVHTIAMNLAKNEIRNRSKKPTLSLDEPISEKSGSISFEFPDAKLHPERLMGGREAKRLLNNALKRIPYKRRKIFILMKLKGLSLVEVVRIMKCPVGTVKSSVSRVKKTIGPELMKRIG